MKTTSNAYMILIFVFTLNSLMAQSYEETSFIDITTTPSASRSANFIDINGDGWDDIYFSNGPSSGQNNMLYINNRNGTFTTITSDDIVTENGRSDGVSFADVDNDGDLDCFEVTYGFGAVGRKNYFYRNNGMGNFTYEPNIAMGAILTYSEMATWVDINDDQFLDLYFTNSNGDQENLYYENQTDGSFQRISNLVITNEGLKSRSVDWIDYDNDGDCDLYITNEENTNNSLFRNDGANNYVQIINLPIVEDGRTTAGSSWADVDNDGDFDLFLANWEGENNQIFINDNGTFIEQTSSEIAQGGGNSFGSAFGDMDNDGDLDLLVCNAYFTGQTKNFVYLNDGNGNFSQDTTSDLANHTGFTFGCAFGDYDNDGWLDIILANTFSENQENSLFHNTGVGNNWVKILCKGVTSNASAVGAKLRLQSNINGQITEQYRKVAASSGYCSQSSYTNHFGLGDASVINELQITWPSGTIDTYLNIDINGFYVAEEGIGLTLGNKDISFSADISIYPNPSKDVVNIDLNKQISSTVLVELYDQNAKRVFMQNFSAEEQIQIKKNTLSEGIYILQISTGNSTATRKIIFQ